MRKTLTAVTLAVLVPVAGTLFAANELEVNADAALNGTSFGLEVKVDPAGSNSVYVQSDHPNSETHMKVKLWVSAANLDAPGTGSGRNFRFLGASDIDDQARPHKIFFLQRQRTDLTAGNWRLAVWSWNTDLNTYQFMGGFFMFSYKNTGGTGKVQIECEWTKATSGSNGSITCNKIGTAQTFTNSTADSDYQTDLIQLGLIDFDNFPNGVGDGDSSIYFDEYESYR